jgi:B-cell receptor-associated protein 31
VICPPTQVFLLLVAEMAVFIGLIIPLPYTLKRKLFTFISESAIVAKIQYGLKVGISPTSSFMGK